MNMNNVKAVELAGNSVTRISDVNDTTLWTNAIPLDFANLTLSNQYTVTNSNTDLPLDYTNVRDKLIIMYIPATNKNSQFSIGVKLSSSATSLTYITPWSTGSTEDTYYQIKWVIFDTVKRKLYFIYRNTASEDGVYNNYHLMKYNITSSLSYDKIVYGLAVRNGPQPTNFYHYPQVMEFNVNKSIKLEGLQFTHLTKSSSSATASTNATSVQLCNTSGTSTMNFDIRKTNKGVLILNDYFNGYQYNNGYLLCKNQISNTSGNYNILVDISNYTEILVDNPQSSNYGKIDACLYNRKVTKGDSSYSASTATYNNTLTQSSYVLLSETFVNPENMPFSSGYTRTINFQTKWKNRTSTTYTYGQSFYSIPPTDQVSLIIS